MDQIEIILTSGSEYPYQISQYHMYIEFTQTWSSHFLQNPGGRLNKKDGLSRYGDSHVKDKTS